MIRPRQFILFMLLVVPGSACCAVCLAFALQDWHALQNAYANFARLAAANSDLSTLFVAEAQQNIHRINLFAEVVWALLGAVVAAIGVQGLCSSDQRILP